MIRYLAKGLRDRSPGNLPAMLRSRSRTRTILQRERSRADRTGDVFSVLALSPRPPRNRPSEFRKLARLLKRRLRSTDEVGWLDRERLAAVLPSTPLAGAQKVVDDVQSLAAPSLGQLDVTVYSYPDPPKLSDPARETVHDCEVQSATSIQNIAPMEPLFFVPLPRWKRMLDVAGATFGLIALSPLLLSVAAAVKLSSPGPVLFRQRRTGHGGKPFMLYKFRSMVADAERRKADLHARNEQDGPAFKVKDDPRVTPLGRVLRATSIDELPQLWNVLRGDMSLVGPRPLPCDEADACQPWQRQRVDVAPGLTCIWQVEGRSRVTFDDWIRMDVRYIRRRSPWHDVKLLAKTLPAVILQRGS
jgi:lipopolysaccharide/colanic/teichoic acid biosynthesis glycosyltransferase